MRIENMNWNNKKEDQYQKLKKAREQYVFILNCIKEIQHSASIGNVLEWSVVTNGAEQRTDITFRMEGVFDIEELKKEND
jgi:hypothetical protein